MGLELKVTWPGTTPPSWPMVVDLLARQGVAGQLKMIDNELAFPDEVPGESWRELRVGFPSGMVTIRRDNQRVRLVTWGNADAELLRVRSLLAWAIAESTGGRIETENGPLAPEEYLRGEGLLPGSPATT